MLNWKMTFELLIFWIYRILMNQNTTNSTFCILNIILFYIFHSIFYIHGKWQRQHRFSHRGTYLKHGIGPTLNFQNTKKLHSHSPHPLHKHTADQNNKYLQQLPIICTSTLYYVSWNTIDYSQWEKGAHAISFDDTCISPLNRSPKPVAFRSTLHPIKCTLGNPYS